MKWILILTLFPVSTQQGGAIAHIEFLTQRACENAKKAWYDGIGTHEVDPPIGKKWLAWDISGKPFAVCVPKE